MIFKSTLFNNAAKVMSILTITGMVAACGGAQTSTNTKPAAQTPASQPPVSQPPAATAKPTEGKTISIGTTPVGVSYNSIGNGLASVISTNSPIRVSVKPFAGLSAWGPLMEKGEVELGVASGPELVWAFKGENGFDSMKKVRLLVRGNYLEATGIVVRKDSNIKSVADLKGKRVSSDYPGSVIGKQIVEAALVSNGLDWKDVKKVPIPTTLAGIEALRDKRLDGAFALTATTPVIVETHTAVGLHALHFLDNTKPEDIGKVSPDVIKKITERVPGARLTKVPANGYIAQETVGIEYPAMMVGSALLSDETVYEIMKTLWTHYEKLAPIHLWLKSWTPQNMFDPNPTVPYHPGAVKFFKEKGLWNDSVEKIQQDLLKQTS